MIEKLELFDRLYSSNDIYNADLIIKNLLNKNIGNWEVFKRYYDFKIKVANWDIDIPTRKLFLNEIENALIFFSENTDLSEEVLEFIANCRSEILNTYNVISELEVQINEKRNKEISITNNNLLEKLVNLKHQINQCKSEEGFQQLLIEIQQVEEGLEENLLKEHQLKLYKELTKDYSSIISSKMQELEKVKLINYNKKAVKDFNYVFEKFKKNESIYKENFSQLSRLVSSHLFSYDSSKLFNETLIYYNQVYSLIFSKLSDQGKFKLTEIAIENQK